MSELTAPQRAVLERFADHHRVNFRGTDLVATITPGTSVQGKERGRRPHV